MQQKIILKVYTCWFCGKRNATKAEKHSICMFCKCRNNMKLVKKTGNITKERAIKEGIFNISPQLKAGYLRNARKSRQY